MEILEKLYGMRAGFASLDNIGFCLLEVNLEGEMYTYSIPGISEHCKAENAIYFLLLIIVDYLYQH